MTKPHIAIICSQHCPPARTGTQRYVLNLATYLASAGCRVSLMPVQDQIMTKASYDTAESSGIDLIPIRATLLQSAPETLINQRMQAVFKERLPEQKAPSTRKLRQVSGTRRPTDGSTFNYRDAISPALAQEVQARLHQLQPDIIFATYFFFTPLFRLLHPQKDCLRAVLSIDIFHERAESFKKQGLQPLIDISAKEEAFYLRQSDLAVAITDNDRKAISQIAPSLPAVTAGVAFPKTRPANSASNRKAAIMASDADHAIDGARHFTKEIWPQILEKSPEAELHIIGKVAEHIPKSPNIIRHGYVPDIEQVLNDVPVVINPARVGSGLKISTMEALSLGKAVITSPTGSSAITGDTVRIAENDSDFVNLTLELFNNPGQIALLQSAAIAYAQKNLSPSVIYADLMNHLNLNPQ